MAQKSIQPQYDSSQGAFTRNNYISDLYSKVSWYLSDLPVYNVNSTKRDTALLAIAQKEPILAGVLASVVARDVNRRWYLTGSARQVSSFSRKLLNVNDGLGWRDFISKLSTSYHNTNLGFAAEIGTTDTGVPDTMWSFDPTEVKLTGKPQLPLEFMAGKGSNVELDALDVILGNSMPSVLSKDKGFGRCAVERSLRIAQLALGIFEHDMEKLGAKPPKGILLGKGVNRKEFREAVEEAQKAMSNAEREVYTDILSIFASNDKAALDITPFSTLPDNWSFKEYIEIIVQAYALEFTYNASEFWAVASTNFNQHAKIESETRAATKKGDISFIASLQDQLSQKFLPSSLSFEFLARSEGQEETNANLNSEMLDIITKMYESGLREGAPLIDQNEARILLAQAGFISTEWVAGEEDKESVEIREIRDTLCSNPSFVKRSLMMPEEPIVRYTWNSGKNLSRVNEYTKELFDFEFSSGKVDLIAKSSHEFVKNKYF